MPLTLIEKLISTNSLLASELQWLNEVLESKSLIAAEKPCDYKSIFEIVPPSVSENNSLYAHLIRKNNFGFNERLVLILALAPHLQPGLLDIFKNAALSIHGGQKGKAHNGFLPTAETALFILAGKDVDARLEVQKLFDRDHVFEKEGIFHIADVDQGEPRLSGLIIVSQDFINQLIHGRRVAPAFGSSFPAKLITTEMSWSDLVLGQHTLSQINEMKLWLKHYDEMRNDLGMRKKLKPGYKMLLHGPPGTGKTLTACLLGKETGRDVYRIDLSLVVSKYIGETEKNLAKVFDKAEHSGWILFFDEADALFGSRTKVDSSHDRYANQEVSYLLQRIEDYDGLVILCSNLKNNIDNAFLRRFQSIIHFAAPKAEERLQLWKKSFPEKISLAADIDLQQIAQSFEFTGSHIMNIVAHSTLHALAGGTNTVTMKQLRESISRELSKEGRTF
jgi:hypothetical protein